MQPGRWEGEGLGEESLVGGRDPANAYELAALLNWNDKRKQ